MSELTPEVRVGDCYVAVDPQRPGRVAVWQVPPAAVGKHQLVADDFPDWQAAQRWLEYRRKEAGRG